MDGIDAAGCRVVPRRREGGLEEQSFENRMLKSYIKDWPDASGLRLERRPAAGRSPAASKARASCRRQSPALRHSIVSVSSVRSAATHTRVVVCSVPASAPSIATLRYGVSMKSSVRASARERCSSRSQRCASRIGLYRQIAVEREPLPVHAGRHQREQHGRRTDERDDANACRVGGGDDRAPGSATPGQPASDNKPDIVAAGKRAEREPRVGRGIVGQRAYRRARRPDARHRSISGTRAPVSASRRASATRLRAISIVRAGSTDAGGTAPSRFGTRNSVPVIRRQRARRRLRHAACR